MGKNTKYRIILVLTIVIFWVGYYLRAYIPMHKYLPFSPYEAYSSPYKPKLLNMGAVTDYSEKALRYPLYCLLGRLLTPVFGDCYIIYIAGAIIIFLLGREITNMAFSGFLAFSVYALSSENLLQYMKNIGTAGLCYVLMWLGLLFFLKYIQNKKNIHLIFFIIFSLFALISYHTGATALIMILIGLMLSLFYSSQLDKKIFLSFVGLILFYIFWILTFDISQLTVIKTGLTEAGYIKLFIVFCFIMLFTIFLFLIKDKKIVQSEYLPLTMVILSAVLIFFSKFNFFGSLLSLGAKNYYSSPITLNNYLAQAILLHIYSVPLIPLLFKRKIETKYIFLRGWLIGVILIWFGLIFKNYYSRILDYSFPLMFILFSVYWTEKKKFREIIVTSTITLLIISQLMIYNDPFTIRRYYNQNEVHSVKNIIALNLNGTIASDLRTSALFSYLGKKDVKFGETGEELHDTIFYNYENLNKLDVDYVVLSESMRTIVYSTNFETTPVNDIFFNYYRGNFKQVYNDGLMYVYKIK